MASDGAVAFQGLQIEMIRMIMNYDDAYGNDGDGVDGNESYDD